MLCFWASGWWCAERLWCLHIQGSGSPSPRCGLLNLWQWSHHNPSRRQKQLPQWHWLHPSNTAQNVKPYNQIPKQPTTIQLKNTNATHKVYRFKVMVTRRYSQKKKIPADWCCQILYWLLQWEKTAQLCSLVHDICRLCPILATPQYSCTVPPTMEQTLRMLTAKYIEKAQFRHISIFVRGNNVNLNSFWWKIYL